VKTVQIISLVILLLACENKRTPVITADAPTPVGPYSQGILSGDRLYVSGQIGWKLDGTPDTATIESETQRALENLSAVLKAGGKTFSDVTKVTIYCTNLNDFSRINGVYATYFGAAPPARETIQVVALPKKAHIEISAIAE